MPQCKSLNHIGTCELRVKKLKSKRTSLKLSSYKGSFRKVQASASLLRRGLFRAALNIKASWP